MSLILSGTDGLSDVDGTAATPAIRGTDANTGIFFPAADTIAFAEGGAEVARFDSSGNFGLGGTPTAWAAGQNAMQFKNGGLSLWALSNGQNGYIYSNAYWDGSNNRYLNNGFANTYAINNSSGIHAWYNAPSGTAGNAITFTQAMTLDASGNLGVGATSITPRDSGAKTFELYGTSSGRAAIKFTNSTSGTGATDGMFLGYDDQLNFTRLAVAGTNSNDTTYSNTKLFLYGGSGNALVCGGIGGQGITFFVNNNCDANGYNLGAACTIGGGYVTATGRSANFGGTVNASGADYAEYMTKAGDFTIAKGDVVGIDAQGKLTDVFVDAVSFVVKSTNPSYVGGDTWGSEETIGMKKPLAVSEGATDEEKSKYLADLTSFETLAEAARQLVDRIAFSGQVPVNVTGATAGQYIIPVNDNGAIKGEAVSSPTFEQYQIAVGKVIAIESDGRAKIIVKVA